MKGQSSIAGPNAALEMQRATMSALAPSQIYQTLVPFDVGFAMYSLFTVAVVPARCFAEVSKSMASLGRTFALVEASGEPMLTGNDSDAFLDQERSYAALYRVADDRWSLFSRAKSILTASAAKLDGIDDDKTPLQAVDLFIPAIRDQYFSLCKRLEEISSAMI